MVDEHWWLTLPTMYTCREGKAHVTEWRSNERSPGGIEEEDPSQRESDTGSGLELLMDTGEMELDGDLSDSEGETCLQMKATLQEMNQGSLSMVKMVKIVKR